MKSALSFLATTVVLGAVALPEAQAAREGRLAFRCTLEDGRRFELREQGGLLAINGSAFARHTVSRYSDPEGDIRIYSLADASTDDGATHAVELHIGTDLNPDGISRDGDYIGCRTEATINSAILDALAAASRPGNVVFRCPLADIGSFEVRELNGQLSIDGSEFQSYAVEFIADAEGDVRTYSIRDANVIDGVPHPVNLHIGTDLNPDWVSSDGDTFSCTHKATIDSTILDALAGR